MVISVIFSAAVSPICQLQLYLTVSPPQINTGNSNMFKIMKLFMVSK